MAEKDTTAAEEPKAKAKGPITCGHRNKHFKPAVHNGQPVQADVMVCTLEKGHAGNHQSPYKTVRNGVVRDAIAHWSDAAGQPNAKGE